MWEKNGTHISINAFQSWLMLPDRVLRFCMGTTIAFVYPWRILLAVQSLGMSVHVTFSGLPSSEWYNIYSFFSI